MSMRGQAPSHPIAQLVRATLEADAEEIDVVRMQSQICEKLSAQGHSITSKPQTRRTLANFVKGKAFRTSLAVAPLLMVMGLVGYLFVSTTPVKAYALVQSAQLALQSSPDREYRVSFDEGYRLPFLNSVDEVQLWTRGDRYRVILRRGDKTILWGQDENRRLWVVAPPDKGLSFEAEEIPRELAAFLSYLSLDIKRLTGQILKNCDLSYSEGMQPQRSGTKTVHATAKRDRNQVEFSAADLEIEESTKVIRRLRLTRRINGSTEGLCQFTLVDDRPQTEESYRLRAYLKESDQVLGKTKYYDRMVALFRVIEEFTKE